MFNSSSSFSWTVVLFLAPRSCRRLLFYSLRFENCCFPAGKSLWQNNLHLHFAAHAFGAFLSCACIHYRHLLDDLEPLRDMVAADFI